MHVRKARLYKEGTIANLDYLKLNSFMRTELGFSERKRYINDSYRTTVIS